MRCSGLAVDVACRCWAAVICKKYPGQLDVRAALVQASFCTVIHQCWVAAQLPKLPPYASQNSVYKSSPKVCPWSRDPLQPIVKPRFSHETLICAPLPWNDLSFNSNFAITSLTPCPLSFTSFFSPPLLDHSLTFFSSAFSYLSYLLASLSAYIVFVCINLHLSTVISEFWIIWLWL